MTATARRIRSAVVAIGFATSAVAPVHAAVSAQDLSALSIEELLNVEIVSASRKEQRAGDVPAAVFVLTHDAIRRSGMTTVPELLRLVPGVDVGQINSNKWAVSIRGFNALYANKLLVLVDGRSVYNHLFSGVFWDTLDLMIDDIDRIEVVRGPGGAVWGANAVNGVINIVTKPASDTQGGLAQTGLGSFDGKQASVRYGGKAGKAAYRAFAQWSDRNASVGERDQSANDAWRSVTSGFRVDGSRPAGAYTIEGGVTHGDALSRWGMPTSPDPSTLFGQAALLRSESTNANVVGRWTSTRASGATWQTQSFVDLTRRQDFNTPTGRNAVDVDTQYHARIGRAHDVVAGAGYRRTSEWATNSFAFSLNPSAQIEHLSNAFVQDEMAIGTKVRATAGAKVEHSNEVGVSVQPTARVLWMPTPTQRVWGSVSRALRTPSLADLSMAVSISASLAQGMPLIVRYYGSPDFTPEALVSTEAGYRVEAGSNLSVDIAAYSGRYGHLSTNEPIAPFVEMQPGPPHLVAGVRLANLLSARTAGVEVAAHWTPAPQWRLDGSYTAFHFSGTLDPASVDTGRFAHDGSAPSHQAQLHSSVAMARHSTLDALLFYVGALPNAQAPSYLRTDARLAFTLTPHASLEFVGENLLHGSHSEVALTPIIGTTRIPRAASVRLSWRF